MPGQRWLSSKVFFQFNFLRQQSTLTYNFLKSSLFLGWTNSNVSYWVFECNKGHRDRKWPCKAAGMAEPRWLVVANFTHFQNSKTTYNIMPKESPWDKEQLYTLGFYRKLNGWAGICENVGKVWTFSSSIRRVRWMIEETKMGIKPVRRRRFWYRFVAGGGWNRRRRTNLLVKSQVRTEVLVVFPPSYFFIFCFVCVRAEQN